MVNTVKDNIEYARVNNRDNELSLLQYVQQAEQIDETGDATFLEFLKENTIDEFTSPSDTLVDILNQYLLWSCGPRWKEFLDDPNKFGGVPPT